jgi:hypothetical protein
MVFKNLRLKNIYSSTNYLLSLNSQFTLCFTVGFDVEADI